MPYPKNEMRTVVQTERSCRGPCLPEPVLHLSGESSLAHAVLVE